MSSQWACIHRSMNAHLTGRCTHTKEWWTEGAEGGGSVEGGSDGGWEEGVGVGERGSRTITHA